jgi:hypothetical protein
MMDMVAPDRSGFSENLGDSINRTEKVLDDPATVLKPLAPA